MKNTKVWTGLLAALLLAGTTAAAETETVDGLEWTYTVCDGEASVGGGAGAIPRSTAGDITIPSSLGGYPVTAVAPFAFYNCSNLSSVAIAPAVTVVGSNAFHNCTKLTRIDFGPDVKSVGKQAFKYCNALKEVHIHDLVSWCGISFEDFTSNPLQYARELYVGASEEPLSGDVVIPDGTPRIGRAAFYSCTNMTSVAIPDSVTEIGESAFARCRGLTNVAMGRGVEVVEERAFDSCYGLEAVHINDLRAWCETEFYSNPLYFAGNLYLDGKRLEGTLTVPDGTAKIGNGVFSSYSGLTNVVLPDSVTDIGVGAFSGCSGLLEITIPGGVTNLGQNAFNACTKLGSIEIPGGVPGIGVYAFAGCKGLTNVVIGNGVSRIDRGAFQYCTGLASLAIPDSVAEIGESAFEGCTGLKEVDLGSGLTTVWGRAFYYCNQLAAVRIHDLAAWCGVRFKLYYLNSSRADSDLYSNPLFYARHLFLEDREVGDLRIPDGVAEIGSGFAYCESIESVSIPHSVTNIGNWAFYACANLRKAPIPDSVGSIGEVAFQGCKGLSSVVIPDSVTTIGGKALANCTALKEARIGRAATVIRQVSDLHGFDLFAGCTALEAIIVDERNPRYASDDGVLFARDNRTMPVFCPNGKPGLYAIPDTVTHLSYYPERSYTEIAPFAYCARLEAVVIPPGVTEIGKKAFYGCSRLEEAAIPDSVTAIRDNAFYNCSRLAHVSIPGNATNIGSGAFWQCGSLTNLTIPAGVQGVGYQAFYGTGLKTLCVPASWEGKSLANTGLPSDCEIVYYEPAEGAGPEWKYDIENGEASVTGVNPAAGYLTVPGAMGGCPVTAIGDGAFRDCREVTAIALPAGLARIGNSAFAGCSALLALSLPAGMESVGEGAFAGCEGLAELRVPAAWEGTAILADAAVPTGCRIVYCKTEPVWSYTLEGGKATVTGAEPAEGYLAIPESLGGYPVTAIGDDAFLMCSGLTGVGMPAGVTNIGRRAFIWCESLEAVEIPDNVRGIEDYAFNGCTNLVSVAIGTGLEDMGREAFAGCTRLAGFSVAAENPNFTAADGVLFSIAEDTALFCCPAGKSGVYAIPAEVAFVGPYAFEGCSLLTDVTLPEGLREIGTQAFCGCTGLDEIVIPDSVEFVGNGAFLGCEGLACLQVPGTWKGTDRLDAAEVPAGCEVVYRGGGGGGGGDDADGTDTVDGVEWRYEVAHDGTAIVWHATPAEGALSIPAKLDGLPVAGIGSYAFEDCTGLAAVRIPDGVTWIANDAFRGCSGLQEVSIPSTVSEIDQNAFVDCTSLESVILPEGVESIGYEAFSGCTGLKEVSIPNSVTSIGNEAFEKCTGVRDGKTIPGIVLVDGWVVGYNAKTLPTRLDLSGVRGLADDALAWAGLRSVILSEGLPTIGGGAFHGCDSLEGVSIPDSVVRIGELAFSGCSALTGIEVGEGNRAFSSRDGALFDKAGKTLLCCPGGKGGTYAIPAGVEEIACGAFDGCRELAGLILPDSLENIDESAFGGCWSLEALEAPTSWREKHFDYHGESLFWTEYAEVPEGCTVTYRDAPAQTETEDSPVPVPFAWLETEAADILAAAGGDHEAAALAPAANGLPVWQCYVAGLSTTEPEAEFKVKSISFADGEVQIGWSPDLNENGTLSNRTYTVEGKPALTDDWGPCAPSSRFFRVRVELPPQ